MHCLVCSFVGRDKVIQFFGPVKAVVQFFLLQGKFKKKNGLLEKKKRGEDAVGKKLGSAIKGENVLFFLRRIRYYNFIVIGWQRRFRVQVRYVRQDGESEVQHR